MTGPRIERWQYWSEKKLDHLRPPTTRQLEVLQMKADGMTNGEIAQELCLDRETVSGHLRRRTETSRFAGLFERMGVRNTAQAVAEGIRRGLIE